MNKKGFSLVEITVSVGIFAVLSLGIYQTIYSIINGVKTSRENIYVSALANQYMELARNLPYSKIGTLSGNPHGLLQDLPNAATTTYNGVNYKIYYEVTYVDDPADGAALAGTDAAPTDYKQVKLSVQNIGTGAISSFFTNIVPKGLEGMANGGALAIKVFNANGNPVSGASIHIANSVLSPNIDLSRLSDSSGNWIEVGLPNSNNSYRITVTKNGYSTDRTYPISVSNPNPFKPDSTISNGQVTQVSFAIDQLSNLAFKTYDQSCAILPNIQMEVLGSKLIGTGPPAIPKFDNIYASDSNGNIALNNIEWDNYTPGLISSSHMVYGSSPIQETNILPNTSQNFTLILGPKTANSFLAIIKDAASKNPIEGASVRLVSGEFDETKITGGSVWSQNDWTGGSGQANFTDQSKYFSDDGNASTAEIPTALRLRKTGSLYAPSAELISSTFDTGTENTSYTTLTFEPASQNASTTLKFQVASNNDNATWNFTGPDGTANTYYAVSGSTINSNNNNNRYIRYKVFLSTSDQTKTPVLTSVNINYVSGCYTPGQAFFPGLESASYNLSVSMDGYQTQEINGINVSGQSNLTILLNK